MNLQHSLAAKLLTLFIPLCVACSGGDDDGGDDGGGGTGGGGAANPWNGKTYILQMKSSYWSEPRGQIVLDFADYVPGFLLEISGATTSSYTAKVAPLVPNPDHADPAPMQQDKCTQPAMINAAENTIGPSDFPMNIRHLDDMVNLNVYATVRGLKFDKTLVGNGVAEKEGAFEATLDARDIAVLFTQLVGAGETPTPQMLCDALGDMEKVNPPAPCQPCPHDGAAMCLTLKAVRFNAVETTARIEDVTLDATKAPNCMGGYKP